ncbi:MAG: PP2C family protein-serine/threonine phosphatase [Actinomycetota bacterium]
MRPADGVEEPAEPAEAPAPEPAEAPAAEARTGAQERMTGGGATQLLEWAYICDLGTGRDNNEDYAGAVAPESGDPLFVVADGMGGHAAGEVASRIAVNTMLAQWSSGGGAAHQRLRSAVRAANVAVFDASHEAGRRGMGSTLTALAVSGREVAIGHVGDSRCYLVRQGQASQLTADHSRVGEMLRMRLITAEQAARHPARSMLTRSLGTDPTVQPDLIRHPAEVGDTYVLCSDGLWDSVGRAEIAEIVTGGEEAGATAPAQATAALIELALKRDAPDNVTVAVIRLLGLGNPPAGRRLFRRRGA